MKLSPLSIRAGLIPRQVYNPYLKKKGLLVLSSSELTPTAHLTLPSLPSFHEVQGLKGPSPPLFTTCSATKLERGPCRTVRLVPSWRLSVPSPADRRASQVLKVAAPMWVVEGTLEAAIHTTTIPTPCLIS